MKKILLNEEKIQNKPKMPKKEVSKTDRIHKENK